VGPFTAFIIILAILLVIPATILPGYRRPHGSILISGGATLVLSAIFWLLGGLSTVFNPYRYVSGAFILPFLAYGGVLLLIASWTLSLNAATQARRWLWVALLLCAGLLTFSAILLPFVMPQLAQCFYYAQNGFAPADYACPPANALLPILIVVGYFVSPAAALVYALRPSALSRSTLRRTGQLPEGLTVSRLGTTDEPTIGPDLPS
jgi:hypothetical protein